MYWQIRHRSQLEVSSGATRPTTIRIVVEGSDEHSSPLDTGPLAAISHKLSFRGSRRHRGGNRFPSAPASVNALEVIEVETPSSSAVDSRVFSCRDVKGSCRAEKLLDRDDVSVCTFTNMDAISSPGAAGSRLIDNSSDVSVATPTSYRDESDEVRVRFRFDSVSCARAEQNDVASTCPLPKEPHPVRDQTVHRLDDTTRPGAETSKTMRFCEPPARASKNVEEDRGERSVPSRLRWLLRRRERSRQRGRQSSALRKEIKAARQLGVIMGAFTLCFFCSNSCTQEEQQNRHDRKLHIDDQ